MDQLNPKPDGTEQPDAAAGGEEITQREAIKRTFLYLCMQYEQLGKVIQTLSTLIAPIVSGEQTISNEGKCLVGPSLATVAPAPGQAKAPEIIKASPKQLDEMLKHV